MGDVSTYYVYKDKLQETSVIKYGKEIQGKHINREGRRVKSDESIRYSLEVRERKRYERKQTNTNGNQKKQRVGRKKKGPEG